MVRDTSRTLSVEEAKARLRIAVNAATPSAWVAHYPLRAFTLALIGGYLIARLRIPAATGLMLAEKIFVPHLVGSVRRR